MAPEPGRSLRLPARTNHAELSPGTVSGARCPPPRRSRPTSASLPVRSPCCSGDENTGEVRERGSDSIEIQCSMPSWAGRAHRSTLPGHAGLRHHCRRVSRRHFGETAPGLGDRLQLRDPRLWRVVAVEMEPAILEGRLLSGPFDPLVDHAEGSVVLVVRPCTSPPSPLDRLQAAQSSRYRPRRWSLRPLRKRSRQAQGSFVVVDVPVQGEGQPVGVHTVAIESTPRSCGTAMRWSRRT